jgi:hypothetical protein
MGSKLMISTLELQVTLDMLKGAPKPPTQADADWLRGATDIVNLLIKKSKE